MEKTLSWKTTLVYVDQLSKNQHKRKNLKENLVKMTKNDEKRVRFRLYHPNNKGPFIVCVRAVDKPLPSRTISKFLFEKCKSKLNIHQVNAFKMKVTFSPENESSNSLRVARDEANQFAKTDLQNSTQIYIPEKLVEVMGCIAWSPDEDVFDIYSLGKGKFNDTSVPDVDILDAVLLKRSVKTADGTVTTEVTSTVRVAFEGLLLPDYLSIDNLLIPVREYKRKQMFCEKCLRYNHTETHCNNKPFKSSETDKKCIHCQNDSHSTGDRICPRRKLFENRDKKIQPKQKKTYADMLNDLDPNATLNNESFDTHFPLNLGTRNSRKRQQQQPVEVPTASSAKVNIKRRKHDQVENHDESLTSNDEDSLPPGFRNIGNTENDDISIFIKSFILDLSLPPIIEQMILKFTIPFIKKIIDKFSTLFLIKISQLGA